MMTVVGRLTCSEWTAYCHGSIPYRTPTVAALQGGHRNVQVAEALLALDRAVKRPVAHRAPVGKDPERDRGFLAENVRSGPGLPRRVIERERRSRVAFLPAEFRTSVSARASKSENEASGEEVRFDRSLIEGIQLTTTPT